MRRCYACDFFMSTHGGKVGNSGVHDERENRFKYDAFSPSSNERESGLTNFRQSTSVH